MQKRAILILGMHRSGTSMVARLLNLHGIRLPSQFVEPNEFNERGYWESPDVQNINDAILTASNSAWFDLREWSMEDMPGEAADAFRKQILDFLGKEFSEETRVPFALKDPRICRLAPIWMNVLKEFGAEVSVVIPYRNPLEVAASLKARDGISTQVAFNLWLRHVLDAEHYTRDCERAIVSYGNVISDWQKGMQAIKLALHLDWPEPTQEREGAVNEFLSASLRHQTASAEQVGEAAGVDSLVYQAYRLLLSVEVGKSREFTEEFARLRLELNELVEGTSPDIPRHISKYVKAKVHHPRDPGQREKILAERFSMRESLLDLVIRKNRLESQLLEAVAQKEAELAVLGDQNQQLKQTVHARFQENQELNKANLNLSRQVVSSAHQIQALRQKLNAASVELNSPGVLVRRLIQRSRRLLVLKLFRRKFTRMILASGAFDLDWYLKKYPDVEKAGEPLLHYLVHGADEGRNPSAYFDSSWYLESNPDVARQGINPLLHYLAHGAMEGRDPNPYFSTDWYVNQNPELRESGLNPLTHFIQFGDKSGHAPSRLFDSQWYLAQYTDVAKAGLPPFYHFITYGKGENRLAHPPINTDQFEIAGQTVKVYEGSNGTRREAFGSDAEQPRDSVMLVAHSAGVRLFGAERSFLDVCRSLDRSRYNVIAVVPTENRDYIESLRSVADYVYYFPYHWWRKDVATDPLVVKVFGALLRKHSVDLLYGNTIMLRESFMAAREQNVTSVLHVREIISQDPYLQETIGLPPEAIIEQVVGRADFLLANSRATCREFGGTANARLLYNTVSSECFKHLENEPGSPIYVGLISSNIQKKGLEDFIKLALLAEKELPQFVFRVIGPQTAYSLQLEASLADKGVGRNVEFCGYVDDVADAIAMTNIVVNFSLFAESFGRTPAEAMMAARPVIVYDHGALPELVMHGETGFVIPYRKYAEALACLKTLAKQPELIAELGAAGRKRATQLFDAPVFDAAVQTVFSEVLAAGAEARRARQAARDHAGPKLKIAYFLWHFPVPSETFVLNELRYLVEQGNDVVVFCKQSPHPDFTPDFPIQWTQVSSPEDLAQQLVATGCSVAHGHFVYPTVTEFLWPACERAGVPFTFIAHAQDIFRHVNVEKNRIADIVRSPLCLRLFVLSNFHREYVIAQGVPPDKIVINPNAIDASLFAAGAIPDRAARKFKAICAVHRFCEKKGLEHLIRAGKELAKDGIRIDLYGYGPLEESYRSIVAELGLKNVKICGLVENREQLLEVFRNYDLFACPSVRAEDGDMDGIPTSNAEAMAAGLPVLTTAISGIPDLVTDGITGVVCEATPEAITAAVRRYYAMPVAQVDAMIEFARRTVERKHDVRRLARILLRVWRKETIDIIIVSWTHVEEHREVLRRLYEYTSLPFHIVVSINSENPEVLDILEEYRRTKDNITLVHNGYNAMVGPGTNLALEAGQSDIAIYVCGREGFALRPGWEIEFVHHMGENPEVGLAGTLCHAPKYLTGAQYPDGISLFPKFRNGEFAAANPDRAFFHVQGGLFAMRRAMYEEIGGFSVDVPHDYTDIEYSFYAESCGWKLGAVGTITSIFNKTRPPLAARIDETIMAAHPPKLEELPALDRIAAGHDHCCNLCAWQGESFGAGARDEAICPQCGSTRADRTLYRWLTPSIYLFRRLPAVAIGLGGEMERIWASQFQGPRMSAEDFLKSVKAHQPLPHGDGRLHLGLLRGEVTNSKPWRQVLSELARVLPSGAVLLVQPAGTGGEDLSALAGETGFLATDIVRFGSHALQFDWAPLHIWTHV